MYGKCLIVLCVAQLLAAQEIFHNPGGPHQFANDLHRFGDASLDDRRDNLFDVPKDSFLTPPPKASHLENVRDIVQNTIARAIDVSSQVSEIEIAAPDERHLAVCLSLIACACVVFCGVLPAIFFPIETGTDLHTKRWRLTDFTSFGHKHLNLLLSFAVGTLAGDVCLHIFPEIWSNPNVDMTYAGLWSIAGLLLCFLVEKCCEKSEESQHRAAAILNLVANLIDNFTHGLAVASSFLISIKFGMLTTLAILLHEIPHEISDFAILLRADFNRWQAIKAQLMTSTGGIVGAACALLIQGSAMSAGSVYVLAFTAGGFLNIALVEILPDIMKEENPRESLKQCALVLFGIGVMAAVNMLHF